MTPFHLESQPCTLRVQSLEELKGIGIQMDEPDSCQVWSLSARSRIKSGFGLHLMRRKNK